MSEVRPVYVTVRSDVRILGEKFYSNIQRGIEHVIALSAFSAKFTGTSKKKTRSARANKKAEHKRKKDCFDK